MRFIPFSCFAVILLLPLISNGQMKTVDFSYAFPIDGTIEVKNANQVCLSISDMVLDSSVQYAINTGTSYEELKVPDYPANLSEDNTATPPGETSSDSLLERTEKQFLKLKYNLGSDTRSACMDLIREVDLILKERSEKMLKIRKDRVEKMLKSDSCDQVSQIARSTIKATSISQYFSIRPGQTITVKLKRTENGETTEYVLKIKSPYTYKIVTGPGLMATFPLQYIPLYFSEPLNDGSGKYKISEQRKPTNYESFAPAPSIIVTVYRFEPICYSNSCYKGINIRNSFRGSIMGGIGLSNQKGLYGMFGYGLTHISGLNLSVGFAYLPTKRLAGQYTEGQIVSENLTSDQLHTDIHTFRPFVNLSYVFKSKED